MLIFMLSPWIHLVFEDISSIEHVFEACKLFNFMHVACSSCSWKLVWIWVELIFPWALILQIELWTMLYYVFANVFQEMSPRGLNLMLWKLNLSLRFKSGNSRFWTHARAGWLALEREIRALSTLHRFKVRSSGIIDARAGHFVSCLSGCRAPNQAWFSPI